MLSISLRRRVRIRDKYLFKRKHYRYRLEADAVLHLKDGRYALNEFKLGSSVIDDGARHLDICVMTEYVL